MLNKVTNIKKTKCKNEGIETMCVMLENPKTPKIKSRLYETNDVKITGTCAFGEIGVQLNMKNFYIHDIIIELVKLGIPERLVNYHYSNADLHKSILKWNNEEDLTKPQIAQEIRKKFGDVE